MTGAFRAGPATIEDFLRRSETERIELIRGTIVEKAAPSNEHQVAQASIDRRLAEHFSRKPGGRFPGGWRFIPEPEVRLGSDIFRPDLTGYRRERLPTIPPGRPLVLVPDWVCEILSPSYARHDRVEKLQTYFRAGIPHYWLVDPLAGTLEVLRRTEVGYTVVLTAGRGQRVRAEPFDAVELRVDELFGADPEDDR